MTKYVQIFHLVMSSFSELEIICIGICIKECMTACHSIRKRVTHVKVVLLQGGEIMQGYIFSASWLLLNR